MELRFTSAPVAHAVAATSGGSVEVKGDHFAVNGDPIIIDLDQCALLIGRALSDEERESIEAVERFIHPHVHIERLGNRIYVFSRAGTRTLRWNVPEAMVEQLKRNAVLRDVSLGHLMAEMTDWFLTTYGEADRLAVRSPGVAGAPRIATDPDRRVTRPRPTPPFPEALLPDRTADFLVAWREKRAALGL